MCYMFVGGNHLCIVFYVPFFLIPKMVSNLVLGCFARAKPSHGRSQDRIGWFHPSGLLAIGRGTGQGAQLCGDVSTNFNNPTDPTLFSSIVGVTNVVFLSIPFRFLVGLEEWDEYHCVSLICLGWFGIPWWYLENKNKMKHHLIQIKSKDMQ